MAKFADFGSGAAADRTRYSLTFTSYWAMFSGASTPQRTTRRSARASRAPSALANGSSTPLASASPAPSLQPARTLGADLAHASQSRAPSGSPAPSRRSARSLVAASDVGSAMDLDEHRSASAAPRASADKTLVQDEHYNIVERRNLPAEVRRVVEASGPFPFDALPYVPTLTFLNDADPYVQPVKGTIDPITGFGLLVSNENCYVWNAASVSCSATASGTPCQC